MTIATSTNTVTGRGNGVTTSFAFQFYVPNASALVVTYTNPSGVSTTLSPSQYSVTGIGLAGGGSVTYPLLGSPIITGASLTIQRIVPYTQPMALTGQGAFFPQAVESALDNLEMQVQQLANQVVAGVSAVTSVNGRTGAVTLIVSDVATALGFFPLGPNLTGPITSLGNTTSVASQTGTGSTFAMQVSPAFTGTPSAPTATLGTNTTQLATTAFVQAAVAASVTGVSSFNTRTGAISLTSSDVTTALSFAPIGPNLSGVITSAGNVTTLTAQTGTGSVIATQASPAFTGVPTAPTAAFATSTDQIATTAFVQSAVVGAVAGVATFNTRAGAVTLTGADVSAVLNLTGPITTTAGMATSIASQTGTGSTFAMSVSPAFTGVPTAPTAAGGTNTTQIATTAFVTSAVAAATAGVSQFNGRTGAVSLLLADVTGALGYTPANKAGDTFTGSVTASTLLSTGAVYSNDGTTVSQMISSGGIMYLGTTSNHPVNLQANNVLRATIDTRLYVVGNSEQYGFGVRYSASGGPVFFGPTDNTVTPGFAICTGSGATIITGSAAGAISCTGSLAIGGVLALPTGTWATWNNSGSGQVLYSDDGNGTLLQASGTANRIAMRSAAGAELLSVTGSNGDVSALVGGFRATTATRNALNIAQTGSTSTATPPASLEGGTYFNHIDVAETINGNCVSSGVFLNALYISHTMAGTQNNGGRNSFEVRLTKNCATRSDNANRNYCAAAFTANDTTGDGGGVGTEKGALFGINPCVDLGASATNYVNITAIEANYAARTGSTVLIKAGIQSVAFGYDAVHGSLLDCGFALGAQGGAAGTNVGIAFTDAYTKHPVISTGTLIATVNVYGTGTVANGIDFSSYTITGNFLKSAGFAVSGAGRLDISAAFGATNAASIINTSNVAGAVGLSVNCARGVSDGYGLVVTCGGVNQMIVSGDASNPVSIVVGGALKTVGVGAADSGGTGFRMLRVAN